MRRGWLRKVGQRFGEALGACRQMMVQLVTVAHELLLEQGMKHYRRSARVFHAPDVVNVLRQG